LRLLTNTLLPLFLFVGVLSGAQAQQTAGAIDGDTQIQPFSFARLAIKGSNKVIWDVTPDPVRLEEIAGELVFSGLPGETYRATATIVDFEGKTVKRSRKTVHFLPLPGPIPPPGPGPLPPGPVPPGPTPVPPGPAPVPQPSALEQEIRAAAPTWAAADYAKMAIAIRRAATMLSEGSPVNVLIPAMQAKIQETFPQGSIPVALAGVLGREVNATVPRSGTLDKAQADRAKLGVENLAAALDRVAATVNR
jgi:hypothetical protein